MIEKIQQLNFTFALTKLLFTKINVLTRSLRTNRALWVILDFIYISQRQLLEDFGQLLLFLLNSPETLQQKNEAYLHQQITVQRPSSLAAVVTMMETLSVEL